MSSILKALKKLEEEKSHLEEEQGINVSREILRQPVNRGISVKWLWLGGSAAAAVIILLTVALVRKSPPTAEVKQPQQDTAAVRPAPPIATGQKKTAPAPAAARSREIRPPAPTVPKETAPKQVRQLPPPKSERSLPKERPAPQSVPVPIAEPQKTEPPLRAAPARPQPKSDPTLTLSGIAWNKDSADRLAIINGQPTAIGATISGAVVEEILPDRVKMTHNGRKFELLIGRTAGTD